MSFIKVTTTEKKGARVIYLNSAHITYLRDYFHEGKRTCTHIGVTSEDEFLTVQETPEQIIDLINGKSEDGSIKRPVTIF